MSLQDKLHEWDWNNDPDLLEVKCKKCGINMAKATSGKCLGKRPSTQAEIEEWFNLGEEPKTPVIKQRIKENERADYCVKCGKATKPLLLSNYCPECE